jgi:2-iminobutanoate/2-iminopropanoate deaminase
VTGHGDLQPDFSSRFPGDPVAQTRHILEQVRRLLAEAGYSIHDIVRHDWTFTSGVTQAQFGEILGVWADFLADADPKPASGTLRYVDRLAAPDMMVEYEFLIAR